jgi:PAS domain S-box-containing protein
MLPSITSLFDTSRFIPRVHCIADRAVSTSLLISDAVIAICYFAIPFLLLLFLRKRSRVQKFRKIDGVFLVLCAAFVFCCGLTHLTDVFMMWWPVYHWDVLIRAITALVSVGTGILMIPVVKRFILVPSSESYESLLAEAHQSKNEMQALTECSPVAIFRADSSGRITYINQYWLKLTGYSAEEIYQDQSFGFVLAIHPEDRRRVVQFWNEYLSGEKRTSEMEFRVVHKSTWVVRWVHSTINEVVGGDGYVGMAVDITDQKELELYRENVTEAITENAPDALFMLDDKGIITYANSAAEQIFGYLRQDLIGRELHGFLHKHPNGVELQFSQCPLMQALEESVRLKAHEDVFQKRNREFVEVSVSISPFVRSGKVMGAVMVVRDDSARKRHAIEAVRNNEILQRMNEALQRSNDDLKSFAYAASHDLQEPLRAIGGFSQMLILKFQDVADAEAIEYMRFITEGVARMGSMIRDLLEYTRIESKGQPFEEVRLSSVFKNAISNVQKRLDECGAVIACSDVMPIVKGDAYQLRRVFQNLLLNAIKFRKQDVPLCITVKVVDFDRWFWGISVEDNGVGIEELFREKIFQLFKRLDYAETDGTGIGLTVCRKIITRHGGKIWVDSKLGVGSNFWFTLPKMDLFSEMPKTSR